MPNSADEKKAKRAMPICSMGQLPPRSLRTIWYMSTAHRPAVAIHTSLMTHRSSCRISATQRPDEEEKKNQEEGKERDGQRIQSRSFSHALGASAVFISFCALRPENCQRQLSIFRSMRRILTKERGRPKRFRALRSPPYRVRRVLGHPAEDVVEPLPAGGQQHVIGI